MAASRTEADLLGAREVPDAAYYGIHTLRAVENFAITGTPLSAYPRLIEALACVKEAAALANRGLGLIDEERAGAIVRACQELRAGALRDQFVVDVIQGGAGTSTNMNVNEVVANRALELLGRARGDYPRLHPNEHVNLGQSTNDVVPTAMKIAAHGGLRDLIAAVELLREAFNERARAHHDLLMIGRTQLQDAVPMTLGQQLSAYAVMLEKEEEQLRLAAGALCEINLGATAVGTGLTAHPEYAAAACRELARLTGLPLVTAADLVEATQDPGPFVQLSGRLRQLAVKLSKICNDLRLLSSGPRAGMGELIVPPVQAGSSIMPGKVNPVIPEVVNQIAFEVMGNDLTVSLAAEAGQLQLNAFLPVLGHSLFKSLAHLRNGCVTLTERCVRGLGANRERMADQLDRSLGMVTALNPHIGYAAATEVAEEALRTGRRVSELVLEKGLLRQEELAPLFDPGALTGAATRRSPAPPPAPLQREPAEEGALPRGALREASASREGAGGFVSTGHLPASDEVRALVVEAHERFRDLDEGENSRVYPSLAQVPPALFGVCVVSLAGDTYGVGDFEHRFTLMSVSKPFLFALVCDLLGAEVVRDQLGVNSTGLAFNSLAAIERSKDGKTNPMVNAGAMAATALAPGRTVEARWRFIREGLSRFAGRELSLNPEVYASASSSNDRNRSIALLLRCRQRIQADAAEVTELYTRQCSLDVSARDLAVMGATLADGGVNPLTGEEVASREACQRTLAVMATAGLYETSGEWLYDIGLPGKSGIGGGIVTVSPGKGGLGTFAPPLDGAGNSVKGQRATRFLSQRLGLNLFLSKPVERAPVFPHLNEAPPERP